MNSSVNEYLLPIEKELNKALLTEGDSLFESLTNIGEVLNPIMGNRHYLLEEIPQKNTLKHCELDLLIAYSDQKNLESAINVFEISKSIKLWVQLMDDYFDEHNKDSKKMADELMLHLKNICNEHLYFTIHNTIKTLMPTLDFYEYTQNRLKTGSQFSKQEIIYFIERNSLDNFSLSTRPFAFYLKHYNTNTSLLYYYNKIIVFIEDDFDDIREDIEQGKPNMFVMASELSSKEILAGRFEMEEIKNSARETMLFVLDYFKTAINGIVIPSNFNFLKKSTIHSLTRLYRIIK